MLYNYAMLHIYPTVPFEWIKVFQAVVLDMCQTVQPDITIREVNVAPKRPKPAALKNAGIYHFKVFPQHRAEVLQFAENLYTIWKLTRNT